MSYAVKLYIFQPTKPVLPLYSKRKGVTITVIRKFLFATSRAIKKVNFKPSVPFEDHIYYFKSPSERVSSLWRGVCAGQTSTNSSKTASIKTSELARPSDRQRPPRTWFMRYVFAEFDLRSRMFISCCQERLSSKDKSRREWIFGCIYPMVSGYWIMNEFSLFDGIPIEIVWYLVLLNTECWISLLECELIKRILFEQ